MGSMLGERYAEVEKMVDCEGGREGERRRELMWWVVMML